jgi:hypothetical protein
MAPLRFALDRWPDTDGGSASGVAALRRAEATATPSTSRST